MRTHSHSDVSTARMASQTGSASTLGLAGASQVACVVMKASPEGTWCVCVFVCVCQEADQVVFRE